jgi:hypothetical protein
MPEIPVCPECRVPRLVTAEQTWLSDGAIVQARFWGHRMAFVESENLDPLFKGIEELAGMAVERILVNVSRRATLGYMLQLVSDEVRVLLNEGKVAIDLLFDSAFQLTRILGYGDPALVDLRFEQSPDDYAVVRYRDPCSVPIIAGAVAGAVEAFIDRTVGVTYSASSPDTVDIRVFESVHPLEMRNRLWFKPHQPAAGDIELRKCATCGGPAHLSLFSWDLDAGRIIDRATGRRVAMIGPPIIDTFLEELRSELGESVTEIVVEAQRRFVRNGHYPVALMHDQLLREQLALRGLGDLKELEMDRSGARLRLDNAALPLFGVGLMLGLYELAFGIESRAEWEISEDGTLTVNVAPWN